MSPEVIAWCNDYFRGKCLRVLEWGAGVSSVVYPKLLAEGSVWIAVETDINWVQQVNRCAPGCVVIIYVPEWPSMAYVEPFKTQGPFDVVLVDGKRRPDCIEAAKTMLKPGGVILLHDAQREEYHAACEGLRREVIEGSETDHLWVLRP